MNAPRPSFSRAALAVFAASLGGCMLGPDYVRPASTLPAHYAKAEETSAATAAATVETEWWKAFADAELNALIERALQDAADLRIAAARVEQADAQLRQANSALFPALDADASANRSRSSQLGPNGARGQSIGNDFRLGLSTAYELDFWGKYRRAREAAQAQALASRYGRDTVRLSVAGAVATSYFSLRSAEAQLVATEASLKTREEALRIAQRRYDSGSTSRLDLEQASTALANAAAQQSRQIQSRDLLRNQLALLVGAPELEVGAGRLLELPLPPAPPAGIPSRLLDARPDIAQAEQQLVSANAQIGVAKAALFPSISLTGAFGGESADLADLFKAGARTWSAGAMLNLPLFDAGRRSAAVDAASAVQKEAAEQYRKTVETAFREVRDALVTLRQSAQTETALVRAYESANRAERISRARYEAGSAAFLELLDAQRSVNEARILALSARENRLNATVSLYKALGGGWQNQG